MKRINLLALSCAVLINGFFLLQAPPAQAILELDEEITDQETTLRDDGDSIIVVESDEEEAILIEESDTPLLDQTAVTEDGEASDITTAAQVETFNTEMSRFQVAGLDLQAGNMLRIFGDSNKDIFAAANSISIEDTVDGDIFAGCNDFSLTGTVEGDVRVGANIVTIDGQVKGNLLIFASTVILTKNADLDGHVNIYAATVTHEGVIEKTAHIGASSIAINGTLNNSATLEAESVQIGSEAVLEKETLVKSPSKPSISGSAYGDDNIVYEKTTYNSDSSIYTPEQLAGIASIFIALRVIHIIFWAISCLLLGIVMIVIWPKWSTRVPNHMRETTGKTWLTGALFLFLVPVAIIILMVTVIGLPIAMLLGLAYIILFHLGRIFLGIFLGRLILKPQDSDTAGRQVLQFVIGYLLLTIVLVIPVLGWGVSVLAAMWGIGGIVHLFLKDREPESEKKPTKKTKETKSKSAKKEKPQTEKKK